MSTAMTMLLTRLVAFNDGALVTQNNINEMALRDRDILEEIIKEKDSQIKILINILNKGSVQYFV